MRVFFYSLGSIAGMLSVAAVVQAQAGSAATTLQYRSTLADYRAFDDAPVAPWIKANETVGAIGGWRAYAKEARQPPAAAGTAAPTPAGAPEKPAAPGAAPAAHTGHGAKP